MKILKAGGEEFTGNLVGKPIRDTYRALDGTDALVLIDPKPNGSRLPHNTHGCAMRGNACREFRELDLRRAKERMRTLIIIDGRRVFEPEGVRGLGFVYRGVGAGNKI
ncbi:MAG: hypothetical protein KKD69_08645 [Euryarchaeota archaeon]|nr:hypothetical protein [Euryarchaeota archaeon]